MAKNPFLTALERYQQRAGSGGALQQELSLRTELEDLIGIQEAQSLARGSDVEQFADVTGDIAGVTKELQNLEQNRSQGASKALLSKLTTLSSQSEMSRRVNVAASSSGVYMQSLGRVKIPTARLESDYANNMSQIADLGDELKSMAGGLDNPDTLAAYKSKVAQMTQFESAAALSRTTLRTQHKMGLDPRGTVTAAQHAASRAEGMVGKFDIEARARGGEFGSLNEESGRLATMFGTLQVSLENYNEAQSGSTEAQEAAGQRLRDITKEISEQEGIVATIRRDGGEGGKGGGLDNAANILKILGNVVRAGSETYESLQISQPMQIMENQTRFAHMANRQYETVGSMLEGNQMSFLKTMQMDSFRQALTDQMFGRAQAVKGAGVAGDAITASLYGVGAAAATAATGGLAGAAVASQGLGAVGNVIGGFADIRRGVTAGRTAADMAERSEAFFEALQAIPAKQLQGFETQTRGAYTAATGFGMARSNTVMKSLLDLSKGGFVDQAVQANISPTELLELTALAGQTVGGADFERGSLLSAGRFEQAGLGSKQQYVSMLGQLSDVGGRDRNLEETLKKAVSVGMDDSKNISRMVSATVSLSEGGALQGLDVSELMGTMLTRGFAAAGPGLTASQRTKMAGGAAANLDALYKQGGTDIFSLSEYQQFAELLPGASYEQYEALQVMGADKVEILRTLAKDDKSSASYQAALKSLERTGLDYMFKDAEGELQIDKLKRSVGIKTGVVTQRAFGVTSSIGGEGVDKVARWLGSQNQADWDALSPQEQSIAKIRLAAKIGDFKTVGGLTGGKDPSGAGVNAGEFRSGVMRKIQSKAVFDYNEMSAGNKKLEELFGVKDEPMTMPADPSGMDWDTFNKTFMTDKERASARQQKVIDLQSDVFHTAAKHPETLDVKKQQADIAASKAPEALTFAKQSKDFKDGVIIFEEGVTRFNSLVKTMEKGAVDKDTTGSEQTNNPFGSEKRYFGKVGVQR